MRVTGPDCRAGVKDGKDGDEDDQPQIRWMCGVSPKEKQPGTEPRNASRGVETIGDVMRRCRLRWHGHVERKDNADYAKACARLVVEGKAPVGRPRKTWQSILSAQSFPRDVHDRKKWRAIGWRKANPAACGTPPQNEEERKVLSYCEWRSSSFILPPSS